MAGGIGKGGAAAAAVRDKDKPLQAERIRHCADVSRTAVIAVIPIRRRCGCAMTAKIEGNRFAAVDGKLHDTIPLRGTAAIAMREQDRQAFA